jgi:hypothetical protein
MYNVKKKWVSGCIVGYKRVTVMDDIIFEFNDIISHCIKKTILS